MKHGSQIQPAWNLCLSDRHDYFWINSPRGRIMSAPLVVSIPHRLGREEAVRRLKTGLGRASASIPVMQVEEERWSGDSMTFRIRALGQIATGQVDVADDQVKVQVVLPWLLQRFAEMAQATIRKRGQLLLTKDGGK
jgi:hypothetical protein